MIIFYLLDVMMAIIALLIILMGAGVGIILGMIFLQREKIADVFEDSLDNKSNKKSENLKTKAKFKDLSNEEIFLMYDIQPDDFYNKNPIIDRLINGDDEDGEGNVEIKKFKFSPGKCLDRGDYDSFINKRYKIVNKLIDDGEITERESSFVEDLLRDGDVSQVVKMKIIDKLKEKLPNEWQYFAAATYLSDDVSHYWILMGAPFPNETMDFTPFVFQALKNGEKEYNLDFLDNSRLDIKYFETLLKGGVNINMRDFKGNNIISKYLNTLSKSIKTSHLDKIQEMVLDVQYLYESGVKIDSAEKHSILKTIDEIMKKSYNSGGSNRLEKHANDLRELLIQSDKNALQNDLKISIASESIDIREQQPKKRKI